MSDGFCDWPVESYYGREGIRCARSANGAETDIALCWQHREAWTRHMVALVEAGRLSVAELTDLCRALLVHVDLIDDSTLPFDDAARWGRVVDSLLIRQLEAIRASWLFDTPLHGSSSEFMNALDSLIESRLEKVWGASA